jgi:hypothetical protein
VNHLPAVIALTGVGAALIAVTILLWRSRFSWPALPAWQWTDIRRLVALVATIAGAAVLTALAWWLLDALYALLVRDVRSPVAMTLAEGLVWGLKLLLAGVLMVILSLGFVMGRRQWRFKGPGGFEGEGGGGEDERAAGAAEVAGAAVDKAAEVAGEVKP